MGHTALARIMIRKSTTFLSHSFFSARTTSSSSIHGAITYKPTSKAKLVTSPWSTQFTLIRHQSGDTAYSSDNSIIPKVGPLKPFWGPNYCERDSWICHMANPGLQFDSGEALMNYYIKTLAPVVGSDEEAKKKIYLVSCELGALGFGVKIDWKTCLMLQEMPDVKIVLEDYYSDDRTNYPGAQSTTAFVPPNWNHRLFNIFSYYYLSEGKMEYNSDHWLININQPDDGFATREQVFDCCIQTLAKVVGSEEKAKEKLYMVWCIPPFGFGAEIDEDTSIKLEGLPNVLKVLPDKAFDVKNKGAGVLAVYPSLDMNFGATFSSCCPPEVYDSDGNIGEPVGVNVLSASQFTQINRNHRLEDIFSYHIHSEWNSEWRDDHWLVVIRKPDGGFADVGKSVHFCIQILAEVVGR